jgi:hypothetical protein
MNVQARGFDPDELGKLVPLLSSYDAAPPDPVRASLELQARVTELLPGVAIAFDHTHRVPAKGLGL